MMMKDYKEFIQTHKNNFWNNLRLGRKAANGLMSIQPNFVRTEKTALVAQ